MERLKGNFYMNNVSSTEVKIKPILENLSEPMDIIITFTAKVVTTHIPDWWLQGREIRPCYHHTTVLPSRLAARLEVTYLETCTPAQINPALDIPAPVGSRITGLEFRVLNEANDVLPLTKKLVSKIRASWCPVLDPQLLLDAKLPDIEVCLSTSKSQTCALTLATPQLIELIFTVRPESGPADHLKISHDKLVVEAGQSLPGVVLVDVLDIYSNPLTKDCEVDRFSVFADSLADTVKITLHQGFQFQVRDISFTSQDAGYRKLWFQYGSIKQFLRVRVEPGPPSHLLHSHRNLTAVQDSVLFPSLKFQLVDKYNNPVLHVPEATVALVLSNALNFTSPQNPKPFNTHGIATFQNVGFSLADPFAPTPGPCPQQLCPGNCFGTFDLMAKTILPPKDILVIGKMLKIHLRSNPHLPWKIKCTCTQPLDTLVAGHELPDIWITILTLDGEVWPEASKQNISLFLWRDDESPKQKQKNFSVSPSGDIFFKGITAPWISGSYSLQFRTSHHDVPLESEVMKFRVVPDLPYLLGPLFQPFTNRFVSNSSCAVKRILFTHLCLYLKDQYGNPVEADGSVHLEIHPDFKLEDGSLVPRLEPPTQLPVINGVVEIKNAQVSRASAPPGDYILNIVPVLKYGNAVAPYTVNFSFIPERENTCTTLQLHEEILWMKPLEFKKAYIDEKLTQANAEIEKRYKKLIRKFGFEKKDVDTHEKISSLLVRIIKEVDHNYTGCNPLGQYMVKLGKYRAYVKDPRVCSLITWVLQPEKDILITSDINEIKREFKESGGQKRMILLNPQCVDQPWDCQLPHESIDGFVPTGDPVYARHYLLFPPQQDQIKCRLLFQQLLGDLILIDTVEDAIEYWAGVTHCPSLMTRLEGTLFHHRGVLGGVSFSPKALGRPKPSEMVTPESTDCLKSLYNFLNEKDILLQLKQHIGEETSDFPEAKRTRLGEGSSGAPSI